MTLQERLKVYEDQHAEMKNNVDIGIQNLHRLEGAIASMTDQIKEEAEAAASTIGEAAEVLEGEHIPAGE